MWDTVFEEATRAEYFIAYFPRADFMARRRVTYAALLVSRTAVFGIAITYFALRDWQGKFVVASFLVVQASLVHKGFSSDVFRN